MAKTYDFRIVVRKAEFTNGFVSIPYGGSKDVYAEKNVEMTLAQARAEQQRMSDAEQRSSATFLSMRYSDDTKAPGIGKVEPIYKEVK